MKGPRHKALENLLQRHERARSVLEGHRGRYAAASDRLEALKAECERRGISPDRLDEIIRRAEARLDGLAAAFEQQLTAVDVRLRKLREET